jgi:hypothetical protein
VPIIVRPLLEQEHAEQPDKQQRAGGDAEHEVGDLKPARGVAGPTGLKLVKRGR